MPGLEVDVRKLPEEIRTKLAQLDLELSEGFFPFWIDLFLVFSAIWRRKAMRSGDACCSSPFSECFSSRANLDRQRKRVKLRILDQILQNFNIILSGWKQRKCSDTEEVLPGIEGSAQIPFRLVDRSFDQFLSKWIVWKE